MAAERSDLQPLLLYSTVLWNSLFRQTNSEERLCLVLTLRAASPRAVSPERSRLDPNTYATSLPLSFGAHEEPCLLDDRVTTLCRYYYVYLFLLGFE